MLMEYMRINVETISRYYKDQIEQTNLTIHGTSVIGWLIFHPNSEQWVSANKAGLIIAFGEDAYQTSFDTNNQQHRDTVKWVIRLTEKPQPKLPPKQTRRGIPMTPQNRLKICAKLYDHYANTDPMVVSKTDDGHYQVLMVNKDVIMVNQAGNISHWHCHELGTTQSAEGKCLGGKYVIALDLRIVDLRDRITKKLRLKR